MHRRSLSQLREFARAAFMQVTPRVRRREAFALFALLLYLLAQPAANATEEFPAWAFPTKPANTDAAVSEETLLSVPGSAVHLREKDIHNIALPPDWFPASHPPAPVPVGAARAANLWACGYCHLPNGQGRPENASLAGLPAAYIRAQVAAFRSGERHGANAEWKPSALMVGVSRDATDDEIARAADYFSRLPFQSHVRVVESKTVPAHAPLAFVYAATKGASTALGAQIVEMSTDVSRFERRDPNSRFVAYVPVGSRARGARLAKAGATPCASCHGEGLRGGNAAIAPPLAGRSPSYLFRQLYGFQNGDRSGVAAQPMHVVAQGMTINDMISLAAYAASLEP